VQRPTYVAGRSSLPIASPFPFSGDLHLSHDSSALRDAQSNGNALQPHPAAFRAWYLAPHFCVLESKWTTTIARNICTALTLPETHTHTHTHTHIQLVSRVTRHDLMMHCFHITQFQIIPTPIPPLPTTPTTNNMSMLRYLTVADMHKPRGCSQRNT
jgi:hypothetical protein